MATIQSEVTTQRSEVTEEAFVRHIAGAFIDLRGHGFDLSALDVEMITRWFDRGMPLYIPMNVMAEMEERLSKSRAQVRIRGLSYISEEVEARFSELIAGHVGCGGCDRAYCAARS